MKSFILYSKNAAVLLSGSFLRPFIRSFVRSFIKSFVKSFVRSFVQSFVKSFVSRTTGIVWHLASLKLSLAKRVTLSPTPSCYLTWPVATSLTITERSLASKLSPSQQKKREKEKERERESVEVSNPGL